MSYFLTISKDIFLILLRKLSKQNLYKLRLVCKCLSKRINEPFFGKPLNSFKTTPCLHTFSICVHQTNYKGLSKAEIDRWAKRGISLLQKPKEKINFDTWQTWDTPTYNRMNFPATIIRSPHKCIVCEKNCLSVSFSQQMEKCKEDDYFWCSYSYKKNRVNDYYFQKVTVTICGCYFGEFVKR